jgi:ATP-dependent Clp protease ATP-binding subunit ClpB
LRRFLTVSPSLINDRHPLGWAPLHTAILAGDLSLVKFILNLPGIDIAVKDSSTFNATTSSADIICRQEELCPNICGTESTSGATALHFACMRGDWEILNMLLDAGASHFVKDNSGRLPMAYFDLERVDPETYNAYHDALTAYTRRWRSLVKKGRKKYFVCFAPYLPPLYLLFPDMIVLCNAIRMDNHEYCKE